MFNSFHLKESNLVNELYPEVSDIGKMVYFGNVENMQKMPHTGATIFRPYLYVHFEWFLFFTWVTILPEFRTYSAQVEVISMVTGKHKTLAKLSGDLDQSQILPFLGEEKTTTLPRHYSYSTHWGKLPKNIIIIECGCWIMLQQKWSQLTKIAPL